MSANDFITSADAELFITVDKLFNVPVKMELWSSDRAWEVEDQEIAETKMSVDGIMSVGYVPTWIEQRLSFSPNSPSLVVFDTLAATSKQLKRPFWLNGELRLKGLGQKYTFLRGTVVGYKPLPPGEKVLGDRNVKIRWNSILPGGI